VWLEQAVREIDAFLDGLDLQGRRDVGYADALGEMAYGFWIRALSNIAGPDMRAKAEIEAHAARHEECEATKAARGEGGKGAGHEA
jgi:hypothetical protein